jgi:hypothetical protein
MIIKYAKKPIRAAKSTSAPNPRKMPDGFLGWEGRFAVRIVYFGRGFAFGFGFAFGLVLGFGFGFRVGVRRFF